MKRDRFAVIIAGGKGERLWPISTSKIPKPFINIFEKSLIELTYERLLKIFYKENIFFIVPKFLKKIIKKFINEEKVIFEPEGKNTFPACIYSTHFIRNLNKDAKIGIFPADHLIKNEKEFIKAIENGFKMCENGFIITFGIKPTRPETGYGYIEIDERINKKEPFIYKVKKFHEKPPIEVAKKYLREKRFFWNSGIFLWDSNFFFEEIKNLRKDIYKLYEESLLKKGNVREFYKKIEANSIDYGLLEYSENIGCCVSYFLWEDLGSFLSFENVFEKDENRNVKIGNVFTFNSCGNIIFSRDKIAVCKDIKDMVIVNTKDITLIIPKYASQEVKEILKELKNFLPEKYF